MTWQRKKHSGQPVRNHPCFLPHPLLWSTIHEDPERKRRIAPLASHLEPAAVMTQLGSPNEKPAQRKWEIDENRSSYTYKPSAATSGRGCPPGSGVPASDHRTVFLPGDDPLRVSQLVCNNFERPIKPPSSPSRTNSVNDGRNKTIADWTWPFLWSHPVSDLGQTLERGSKNGPR